MLFGNVMPTAATLFSLLRGKSLLRWEVRAGVNLAILPRK